MKWFVCLLVLRNAILKLAFCDPRKKPDTLYHPLCKQKVSLKEALVHLRPSQEIGTKEATESESSEYSWTGKPVFAYNTFVFATDRLSVARAQLLPDYEDQNGQGTMIEFDVKNGQFIDLDSTGEPIAQYPLSLIVANVAWLSPKNFNENTHVLVQPMCLIDNEYYNEERQCNVIEVSTLKSE